MPGALRNKIKDKRLKRGFLKARRRIDLMSFKIPGSLLKKERRTHALFKPLPESIALIYLFSSLFWWWMANWKHSWFLDPVEFATKEPITQYVLK